MFFKKNFSAIMLAVFSMFFIGFALHILFITRTDDPQSINVKCILTGSREWNDQDSSISFKALSLTTHGTLLCKWKDEINHTKYAKIAHFDRMATRRESSKNFFIKLRGYWVGKEKNIFFVKQWKSKRL